ncbi:MAG: hypothetical protein K6E93_10470 [Bacteroidales bacterium]|nr:hypothetical protein [Bacteroidales bacterium]
MKKIYLIFALFEIWSVLFSNVRGQDTIRYIDPIDLPVHIRAVKITQYEYSPIQIDGHLELPEGIWKWLMDKSIFADSMTVSNKKIEGSALIKKICRGDGIVDIVVSIDSSLYEIITIAKDNEMCGLETIEVGKKYPLSLFPYYNYPYTMAYNRNEPIYLNGYVIWINRRKLDGNIYISPNIDDVFYHSAIDAEKKIFELIRYCE